MAMELLTDNEGAGRVEDFGQPKGTEWNVGTLPVEGKDHLKHNTHLISKYIFSSNIA